MFLFSERGISYGYRHMDGFSAHAFKWVNEKGQAFFVKYHIKTDVGAKSMHPDEVKEVEGRTKDFSTEDLFNHIASGKAATWTFNV